jgi:sugar/nucleoside kinase (ribokinase family)
VKVPVIVGTGLVALDVVIRGKGSNAVRRCVGGTCGNVLTILRYLGWKAVPVARLASDRANAIVEADLNRWHVDTRFLSITPVAPTPIFVERLLHDAEGSPVHRFPRTCPCCGAWLPRYTPVAARSTATVLESVPSPSVFFFDRPSRGAVALATAYVKQGALVVFEPSAGGEPDLFRVALELADVIKYSDERFATLPPHKPRSSRRLEVQTLGAKGLRYRMGGGRRLGTWHHLSSVKTAGVVDTAGAGDWCTAGMLTHLGRAGREGFERVTDDELVTSLRYGQTLAAWNCGFESARGGMYERTRQEFERDVAALMAGNNQALLSRLDDSVGESLGEICPACLVRGAEDAKTPQKAGLQSAGYDS